MYHLTAVRYCEENGFDAEQSEEIIQVFVVRCTHVATIECGLTNAAGGDELLSTTAAMADGRGGFRHLQGAKHWVSLSQNLKRLQDQIQRIIATHASGFLSIDEVKSITQFATTTYVPAPCRRHLPNCHYEAWPAPQQLLTDTTAVVCIAC